jgi:hypothetical protein
MQKYSELVYNLISLKANEMLYFRQTRFSIRKLYIEWFEVVILEGFYPGFGATSNTKALAFV